MLMKITALPALLVVASAISVTAATLQVPGSYTHIQSAIDAAEAGDTVLIADGTYSGPGNRDLDFRGKAITVTSEHGAAMTIIDCEAGAGRGFVFTNGETASSVLSGLTIQGGGLPAQNIGGNIYCLGTSPIIENCVIRNGFAGGGAGLHSQDGAPTLRRCRIENNLGEGGGGLELRNSPALLVGCQILNNSAVGVGGGIFVSDFKSANPVIFRDCVISGNVGSGGGGISAYPGAQVRLENCLLTGNNSPGADGGAIYANDGRIEIVNSTLGGNSAVRGGGIHAYLGAANVSVLNSIIWNNAGGSLTADNDELPSVSHSDVQTTNGAIWPGPGNLHADPLFLRPGTFDFGTNPPVITDAGDYRLELFSPGIDAGTAAGATDRDLVGTPRPQEGGVDMGAYEFIADIQAAIDVKPGGEVNPINLKSRGKIPVAILSATNFDARTIDLSLTRIGGGLVNRLPHGRWHKSVKDVNHDGLPDLLVHVPTQSLHLNADSVVLRVRGLTTGGVTFSGSDEIRIVPKPAPPGHAHENEHSNRGGNGNGRGHGKSPKF